VSVALGARLLDSLRLRDHVVHQLRMTIGEVRA